MTSSYSLDDWIYFTKAWNLNTAEIHKAGRRIIGKIVSITIKVWSGLFFLIKKKKVFQNKNYRHTDFQALLSELYKIIMLGV